ncbi:protein FAM221A-like [Ciona intestinalis]
MDNRVHLKLDRNAASNVDAYFEYRSIVGDDDHGRLFSPEEYEAYKKKVLPMRMENRLYVSWSNPEGMDCKLVGPETLCFCQHRYKQHVTDFKEKVKDTKELKCKIVGCRCTGYNYVPRNGTQPLRCHCKHQATEHSEKSPFLCKNHKCGCSGFRSSYRCGCGSLLEDHVTKVETREERIKRGHPVANYEPPYAAMGGLTGLSSLIDGYMRLDDSGVGSPSKEYLEQPSTSGNSLQLVGKGGQPMKSGAVKRKVAKRPEWVD